MKDLPNLAVAVIIVDSKRVCLVKRAHDPFNGMWVLPGGFVGEKKQWRQLLCARQEKKPGLKYNYYHSLESRQPHTATQQSVLLTLFLLLGLCQAS